MLTNFDGPSHSIADESGKLWDVDEVERFVKLATLHPELLTHHEQVRWKLIRGHKYLWRDPEDGSSLANLNIQALREHWARFVAVSKGEANHRFFRMSTATWSHCPGEFGNLADHKVRRCK